MRTLPEELQTHLGQTATTVCSAWRVTRRDGMVLGFTEHDHDLAFAGTVFLAASGFRASDVESGMGLAAEASEVEGAFSSDAITDADVAAGRYDGARVEVFLVNWQSPADHLLLRVQEIGEVTRAGPHFRAELRRLTHRLDQVQGRIYSRRCDAALGDGRCGVDLSGPPFRGEGTVLAVLSQTRITVSGLEGFADGFFRYGVADFTSGANAGLKADIDGHGASGGIVTLTLFLPPPVPLAEGDAFTIAAGCDKSFATCRAKFSNTLNFRGFPHMPGTDFALGYADGDTVHDGRPLYR